MVAGRAIFAPEDSVEWNLLVCEGLSNTGREPGYSEARETHCGVMKREQLSRVSEKRDNLRKKALKEEKVWKEKLRGQMSKRLVSRIVDSNLKVAGHIYCMRV